MKKLFLIFLGLFFTLTSISANTASRQIKAFATYEERFNFDFLWVTNQLEEYEVVYCYDKDKVFPDTIDVRPEGMDYLAIDNPDRFAEIEEDILRVTYVGYPHNGASIVNNPQIDDGIFQAATQYAVWFYTEGLYLTTPRTQTGVSQAIDNLMFGMPDDLDYAYTLNLAIDIVLSDAIVPDNLTLNLYDPVNASSYQRLLGTAFYETIDIDVTKKWEDYNNKFETRTDSISIQLYENGEPKGTPVLLNDTNNWSHKFEKLVKLDFDKNTINYTVQEIMVPEKYTQNIDIQENENGYLNYTITNTIIPEITSVTGSKIWSGGSELATKPSATFKLLANDIPALDVENNPVAPITVDYSTTETNFTFENLPKHDVNGDEIVYSIVEQDLDNFSSAKLEGTNTFNNTYQVETTDIQAKKIWVGGNPDDHVQPILTLYRQLEGHEPEVVEVEPTVSEEGNTFLFTWLELPVTDFNANEYTYTVEETSQHAGYESVVDRLTVTNTYQVELTDINIEKVWINAPEDKPDITIVLLADGVEVDRVTLANNETTHTFTDLPKTTFDGQVIVYTLEELTVEGYTSAIEGFVVINTAEPVQEEPIEETPVQDEPVHEEPVKEEPVKEEPVKEQPTKEEPTLPHTGQQVSNSLLPFIFFCAGFILSRTKKKD